MLTIGGNIKKYREVLGWTQSELARSLGKTTGVISNWESELNRPDVDSVKKMLEIFKIDANTFFGWTPDGMSEKQERGVLKKYRSLDARGKEVVDVLLDMEYKRAKNNVIVMPRAKADLNDDLIDLIEMKVYNEPAAAGLGNYLSEDSNSSYEMREAPADDVPDRASFGVLISGDSMEPKIHDGQIAWVEAQPAVDDGEIGIFVFDGNSYCKKLKLDHKKRGVRLVSFNENYDDIFISREDLERLRTIGKVLL